MKKWEILDNFQFEISNFQLDKLTKILLENRGIKTKKEREEYLNPNLDNFTAKNLGINEKDLKIALARIKEAIEKNQQIIVFGDYDVDGVTGAAILWECLNSLGARVMPYIPHRVDEGYGLSKKGIDNVLMQFPDTKLIITVDNGIVANESVDYAVSLGLEIIITDHHVPGEKLPNALAIVHSTKICGAAVGYFLALELLRGPVSLYPCPTSSLASQSAGARRGSPALTTPSENYLDLVALATVADVMPLNGFNRALLIAGLPKLRKTKRPGLKALFEISKIKPDEIGVYEIGHVIAPRLNAVGRLEHAMESLRLICTKNKDRAEKLADLLDNTNRERQVLTFDSLKHAKENLISESKVLFVYSDIYEPGVIGLIAGKLTEEFYRPSIVLSVGEIHSKASARSVSGFNIIEFIRLHSSLLVDAGGHPMAAGFTVASKNLKDLEKAILKAAEEIDEELLIRKIKIDCELPIDLINQELFFEISKLSPFGYGNPEPIFFAKNVVVESMRFVGKDSKHLKLNLIHSASSGQESQISNVQFGAILFGYDESLDLKAGDQVDVVYSISENNWNGNKKLELKIKDIRKS